MSMEARISSLHERITLEARISSLHERITHFEWAICAHQTSRACQQSTGWEEALKDLIIRRDQMLVEHKAT